MKEIVKFLCEQLLWQAYFCRKGPPNDNYYKIMKKLDEIAELFGTKEINKFGMTNRKLAPIPRKKKK